MHPLSYGNLEKWNFIKVWAFRHKNFCRMGNLWYNNFYLIGNSRNCMMMGFMLVCQTYVTPYLMKSWSVSFGDFHPSGRIGKQL